MSLISLRSLHIAFRTQHLSTIRKTNNQIKENSRRKSDIRRTTKIQSAFKMAQPGLTESSDIATMSSYLDLEDRSANSSGSGRGRGKGGRGGKSRGGGGGGRAESREVMISKALSKLLRHAAAEAGLSLDTEGFARVDQVVSIIIFHIFGL